MLHEIHGLPAHILLVHAVVVLLPLAGVLLVASAAWPAARRRIGVVSPVLSLIVLVLVPITTSAGNWLRDRIRILQGGPNAAIDHHAALAHGLLPWAIALFVVSAGVWVLARRYEFGWRPEPAPDPDAAAGAVATKQKTVLPVWVTVLVVVVATAVAVGAVVDVIRIGDAGSQAAWHGVVS